jgi:hypothetical protein
MEETVWVVFAEFADEDVFQGVYRNITDADAKVAALREEDQVVFAYAQPAVLN